MEETTAERQEGQESEVNALTDEELAARIAAEPPKEEETTEAIPEEENPTKETTEEPEPEQTEEEKAKLEARIKAKEEFIGRQSQEIGQLRKQAAELEARLAQVNTEELQERYYENPVEAVNEVIAQREKQAQVQQLQMLANLKENELVVKNYVPDFDDVLPEVVATLKEMQYPDEVINHFKTNPFSESPAMLVNLAERAKLSKRVKALEAENAELRRKPAEALHRVAEAAKSSVTGKTGKTGTGTVDKQIHQMSDAELKEYLSRPD